MPEVAMRGSVLIWIIAVLVGFVLPEQLLPHPQLVFWNINSNLKCTHNRHSVSHQWLAVLLNTVRAYEVIGKSRLMKVWVETGSVSGAAHNNETHEASRLAAGDGDGLFVDFGRIGANIQFPYRRLWYREKIETPDRADFGMVTKFALMLSGIEGDRHTRSYGKHLRINLNVLGNRVSQVFYREFEDHGRLFAVYKDQSVYWSRFDGQPRTLLYLRDTAGFCQLCLKNKSRPNGSYSNSNSEDNQNPVRSFRFFAGSIPPMKQPVMDGQDELGWSWWIALLGGVVAVEIGSLAIWGIAHMIDDGMPIKISLLFIALGLVFVGLGVAMLRHAFLRVNPSSFNNVSQKHLTKCSYCNTVIGMANVLNTDKQIAVIGALAEGSSIRSIERMTGVHRDTIMRLGVRVGKGCAAADGCQDARFALHPP